MIKKIYSSIILITVLLFSLCLPSSTFANEIIETTNDLHELVVQNGMASLNESGQIVLDLEGIKTLNADEELVNAYIKEMEQLNWSVAEGFMEFDANFEVVAVTPEEVTEIVYQESLDNPEDRIIYESELSENDVLLTSPLKSTGGITTYAIADQPPYKNVKSLVLANRAELEKVYNTNKTLQKYGGANAFSATVGWWVGRVKPGGSWDYKVVSGYAPWYKEWRGLFFDGYRYVTSAYIGNYNYGYTGELLFTKSTLLAAGDGVSIITTFMSNIQKGQFKASLDGEDDKAPVRKGYDDAVRYE
ncbi:polymorphic toxin type 44 domain-containing protein [Mesobacillus jeotgali]|uniref:Polymorphic toxin type 44 domain-containing protein n=1 Tax=Mesobacillus jeotgali TaxID=129985 RepID=A0ABY9VI45_9BACI|nr:polymorphic toxin type 44 domain-containing protein [Mesobacillus jeotgali]WNF22491.1 polymorphic toxin type 44 domain-containing protein [Mesobacillus jeotgali]